MQWPIRNGDDERVVLSSAETGRSLVRKRRPRESLCAGVQCPSISVHSSYDYLGCICRNNLDNENLPIPRTNCAREALFGQEAVPIGGDMLHFDRS